MTVLLWCHHEFRIVWSDGFVSDTRERVLNVTVADRRVIETGSRSATALMFVGRFLIGAGLGAFADRRRPIGFAVFHGRDELRASAAVLASRGSTTGASGVSSFTSRCT